MTLFVSIISPLAPTTPAPVPAPTPSSASNLKELRMNTCALDMQRVTSRGVYCVCPDITQGIVEMPINGFMVPHPYTHVTSDVLPMNRDRIAAHAHRTSPNTPVAMGIRDKVSGQWSTAFGWWFASYGEATLKAQAIGSVVYTS